jgi:hypothetical protein
LTEITTYQQYDHNIFLIWKNQYPLDLCHTQLLYTSFTFLLELTSYPFIDGQAIPLGWEDVLVELAQEILEDSSPKMFDTRIRIF